MSNLPMIEPAQAVEPIRALLAGIGKKLGFVPGLLRAMANSPATLRGYVQLREALASGALPMRIREQIAIAVAARNRCRGCLAAHDHFGRSAGLCENELAAARHWQSSDPRASAALNFAHAVITNGGHLNATEIEAARIAGLSDANIVEIAAALGMNILTNLISNLAAVDPDFAETA